MVAQRWGADRGYDTRDFVAAVRARGVTPHVARNDRGRRSAIDGRTTRHPGYGRSLRQRKLVEEVFGWLKTVGGGRKLRYIGQRRNRAWLELAAAAYNLVRPLAAGARPGLGGVRPPAPPVPAEASGGAGEGSPKPLKPVPGTRRPSRAGLPAPPEAVSSAPC